MYVLYMWWKLIHDQRTAFDRLWAARQHAAADSSGTPLYQIPGWALDKTLSRAVVAASLEAAGAPPLARGQSEVFTPRELGDGALSEGGLPARGLLDDGAPDDLYERAGFIDAQVIDTKVAVDEELNAYNRYLTELNWRDPPKHWGSRRTRGRGGEKNMAAVPPSESVGGQRSELPVGDRRAAD
jgi:hypothetical protein